MNCPDQGQLLLYLEKELTTEESIQIEAHLASCASCSLSLKRIEQDLDFACQHLQNRSGWPRDIVVSGQQEVWNNLLMHMTGTKKEVSPMKFRKVAIAAALVLALAIVGSVPAVQTAAANLLKVFRVQNVATLTISPNDVTQIEQALSKGSMNLNVNNFGTIKAEGEQEEINLGYAELNDLGFPVKLPGNLDASTGTYSLQKMPALLITPDVDKVNQLIESLGSSCLLPSSLKGQTFKVTMGDTLVATYPDFRLMQGPAPEIEAPENVEVSEVAKAMIALPIWPDNVRRQLEAVGNWENTLVIPGENVEKVDVNGSDAVIVNNNNGHSLIWENNGRIYILEDLSHQPLNLIEIAESLR
ncbi:MAG: zf-HC2 domain-containing protein [Syntrophomonadaceae bacterium]|jgi:hypothetical protein